VIERIQMKIKHIVKKKDRGWMVTRQRRTHQLAEKIRKSTNNKH